MNFLCTREIAIFQGRMKFLIGRSGQFLNLFWFKDTFSGVIQSKQARRIFLARKTTALTTEGLFQR